MAFFSRSLRRLAGLLPPAWKMALRRGLGARVKPVEQMAMEDLILPGETVLDLGSNRGDFAEVMSRLVGPGGKVVAFEAQPEMAGMLARRLDPLGNVVVVHAAVAERGGGTATSSVDRRPGALGVASRLGPPDPGTGPWEVVKVPTVALDEYLGRHGLRPSFVKMDIEGAEALALRGGLRMLEECRPALVLEVLEPEASRFLRDRGYELWDLCRCRPFDPEEWREGPGCFTEALALHPEIRPGSRYRTWPQSRPLGPQPPGGVSLGPGRYLAETELSVQGDPDLLLEVRCEGLPIWRCEGQASSGLLLRHQVFELVRKRSRVTWTLERRDSGGEASLGTVRLWRVEFFEATSRSSV